MRASGLGAYCAFYSCAL